MRLLWQVIAADLRRLGIRLGLVSPPPRHGRPDGRPEPTAKPSTEKR